MNLFKRSIFPFLIIGSLFIMLQGCVGATDKVVKSDSGQAYNLEEVYSIGLFTPTWQFRKASACDLKVTHINAPNSFGDGYDSESVENCKVIGAGDGFTADTTSPVGPMLMQAAGTVGAGALIGDGIRDSSDTINNSNKQGQFQGQYQKQYQYQNQRQYNKGGGYNR